MCLLGGRCAAVNVCVDIQLSVMMKADSSVKTKHQRTVTQCQAADKLTAVNGE